jgi:5-methylcytosine-specific restriction endonuclease McrA
MMRFFSRRQRKILQIFGGNKCALCRKKLTDSFHADHVIPYSKGGHTTLRNGQAVCAECNLKKGNKNAE